MASFSSGRGPGGRNNNSRDGRGPHSSKPTNPGSTPRLQVCRNFASSGNCHHGTRCNFSHVIKNHASALVSDKKAIVPNNKPNFRGHHHTNNGKGKVKEYHKVSSVSVWKNDTNMTKVFTGSHDGKWRLWNILSATSVGSSNNNNNNNNTCTSEFEHFAGGPVDTVHVASNFFFCGFEASPIEAPDAKAGMVHIWNLDAPQDPPMELWMGPMSKYACSGRVRSLITTPDGRVWSGGSDGSIREWAYNPQQQQEGQQQPPGVTAKAGFGLIRTMSGHLGAVTGLAIVKGVLWSGGDDGTIRLWNIEKEGEEVHVISAVSKDAARNNGAGSILPTAGHAGGLTGIVPFESPTNQNSYVFTSSLDETVKVWNATNGECVASENHGQGVTAIELTSDLKGNPLLLCGLFYGDIMIRGTVSNPPLCLLLKISHQYMSVGHEMGPVNAIQANGNTFFAVADDGKMTAWQIVGDFGL